MPVRKKKLPRKQREINQERQEGVAARRSDSGLAMVKLFLDFDTLIGLEDLAASLGYRRPSDKTKKRYETLSECVTYCVQQLNFSPSDIRPRTRHALLYHRVYQIAYYKKHDENKDIDEIAEFMSDMKYPRPGDIMKNYKTVDAPYNVELYDWTERDIEQLLDEEKLAERVLLLNTHPRV